MDEDKQARRRRSIAQNVADELFISKAEPANEYLPPRAMLAGRIQQLTLESATSWLLPRRTETLAARAARAGGLEQRVAELEGVLSAAREVLAQQNSEKSSLQASLDGATDDKSRLISRLEAMSARAVKAEKLLAEAQQSLMARTVEASRAVTTLADETAARCAAEKKLEPLQDALRAKECKVEELEQVRSELVERMSTLRRTLEERKISLANAEARIKSLTGARAEMDANLPNFQGTAQPVSRTQRERQGRAESIRKKAYADYPLLKRDLDKDDWLFSGQ
jgi:chromosome segregation ATPase